MSHGNQPPTATGGYVPQPGSPSVHNPSGPQYQQQQQQYQYQHQQPYYPLAANTPPAAQFTVSRCALKVLTCVSILLGAIGGILVVIGIPIPVRRFTLGENVIEYYLYEVDVNGMPYDLEDSIRIPFAIAIALGAASVLSACFALPFGIHEMKSLCTTTTQPHRGPIRFARSILLFVAASLGFASVVFVAAVRSNDYSDAGPNVINTFNSSTLCEGFVLLLIGSLVLGLADVLSISYVILGGRLEQVDVNSDQQSLIQQNHYPQQHYPQQQQYQYQSANQQQYPPAGYQGVPVEQQQQYPPTGNNMHPGTTTHTASSKSS